MDSLYLKELREYRVLEMEKATKFLRQTISGHESYDYFKGAVAMLKDIINIPAEMAKTAEEREIAAKLTNEMYSLFEAKLARRLIED